MFTAWKNENVFDLAPRPSPTPTSSTQGQEAMQKREPAEASAASAPKEAYSIINEWLTMRGELESDGDILVKGRVHGNLHCRTLIIDKGATFEGGISAQEVVVRGSVRGTIRTNRIFLEKTAVVDCDIFQESFAAEEGARVKGTLRGNDDEANKSTAPAKQATPLAKFTEASVTELHRDADQGTQEKPRSSSTLYHMLDTARAANGSARKA